MSWIDSETVVISFGDGSKGLASGETLFDHGGSGTVTTVYTKGYKLTINK